jgi:hypothetical protein
MPGRLLGIDGPAVDMTLLETEDKTPFVTIEGFRCQGRIGTLLEILRRQKYFDLVGSTLRTTANSGALNCRVGLFVVPSFMAVNGSEQVAV